ncbi:cell division control protein 2 homolog B-like [Camellia sinensis]|uniref:cell division control protein 2 homolog B-like n=1 Tax=Camellia sinensis TaxID=4442 RepID=UPI0010365977|nr:cell division control protein 2 homolog B-like [Camellia sinensis]
MEKYKLGKVIGIGAYGIVHRGLNLETNQIVAIKRFYTFDCKNGVPYTTIREISMLIEMYHINIVKLLDVISNTKNEWYIIFEYLDLDLEKYMVTYLKDSMAKHTIKYIMHQILSGVMYCHKHRIMHQDLTPDNLLIDLNASVVKIADFGMARAFDFPLRAYSPEVVTIWYKAPEILLGSPVYSMAIDVWSVGCIFAKMLMRQNLFAGASKNEHLRKIFSIMGTPNERTWPGVTSLPYYPAGLPEYYPENLAEFFPDLEPAGVDLLSEMLCMNPARRISARRALGHAYFKKKKRKEKKEKKMTILDPIEEEEEDDDDDDP